MHVCRCCLPCSWRDGCGSTRGAEQHAGEWCSPLREDYRRHLLRDRVGHDAGGANSPIFVNDNETLIIDSETSPAAGPPSCRISRRSPTSR